MTNPSWLRLVDLYQRGIMSLFVGRLPEFMNEPELSQSPEFQEAANRLAQNMVRSVANVNATSWRQAAMKGTSARQIFGALQQEKRFYAMAPELDRIAARNAELIRSLPAEISERVTAHAAKLLESGARSQDLERAIRREGGKIAKSRIRLIARTEISRAETDLTRMRAERIGLNWYQWETSRDQRVRPSHRNMNQVLVAWSDAPQPEQLVGEKSTLGHYHAGQAPNCRCLALPLVSVDEIHWPARVYRYGRITRMKREEFTRVIGIPLAA